MRNYGLGFISDEDLFAHVRDTVEKYRFTIDLKRFNHNVIDPIKLTFDSKVYGKSLEAIIEAEIIRQVDKSNTNHIGYFHQNIFKYIGRGWRVPDQGFDLVNDEQKIYVEMKNKHNTMNSSSAQKTYITMQNTILHGADITCMLVEVIAKKSQDIPWRISLNGQPFEHAHIRRVSIDKFYTRVTGEPESFRRLCTALPMVLEDVMATMEQGTMTNTVFEELEALSPDLLKSLYLLAFEHYDGFGDFAHA